MLPFFVTPKHHQVAAVVVHLSQQTALDAIVLAPGDPKEMDNNHGDRKSLK